MKSIVTLFIVLVSFTLAQAQPPEEGVVYEKKFSAGAHFPAKPKHQKEDGNDAWLLTENNESQIYLLMMSDLEDKLDITDKDKVKQRFDQMLAAISKSLQAKPSLIKDETFGPSKFPAKYIELTMSDGTVYHTRWVLTTDRVIQVVVLGSKKWVGGEKPQAFLKSMRVDKR